MSCAKTLAWYDMIPIASWVLLRGRCRACGSSISIQYPLVEAATAILFALFGLYLLGP
jgi:leader peptidase (prepilin peptidase) / N-methyltransferase